MKKRILSLILASSMVLSMGMVASATDETSEANAATKNEASSKVTVTLTAKGAAVLSVTVPMVCPLAIKYDENRMNADGTAKDPGYVVTTPSANAYKIVNNSTPADGEVANVKVTDISIKQSSPVAKTNFALVAGDGTITKDEQMKLGLGTTTDKVKYFPALEKNAAGAVKMELPEGLQNIESEQPLVVKADVNAKGFDGVEAMAATNTFTILYTFEMTGAKEAAK